MLFCFFFLFSNTGSQKLIGYPIFYIWAHLMTVFRLTRRALWIRYLHFYEGVVRSEQDIYVFMKASCALNKISTFLWRRQWYSERMTLHWHISVISQEQTSLTYKTISYTSVDLLAIIKRQRIRILVIFIIIAITRYITIGVAGMQVWMSVWLSAG